MRLRKMLFSTEKRCMFLKNCNPTPEATDVRIRWDLCLLTQIQTNSWMRINTDTDVMIFRDSNDSDKFQNKICNSWNICRPLGSFRPEHVDPCSVINDSERCSGKRPAGQKMSSDWITASISTWITTRELRGNIAKLLVTGRHLFTALTCSECNQAKLKFKFTMLKLRQSQLCEKKNPVKVICR